jgi:hypothetical protein
MDCVLFNQPDSKKELMLLSFSASLAVPIVVGTSLLPGCNLSMEVQTSISPDPGVVKSVVPYAHFLIFSTFLNFFACCCHCYHGVSVDTLVTSLCSLILP